jgi:hypothetical protein
VLIGINGVNSDLFKLCVETMGEGLLVGDTGGMMPAFSTPFEAMTGHSIRELEGRQCTLLHCTGYKI